MKKNLLLSIILLVNLQLAYAQSATISPASSTFTQNIGEFTITSASDNIFGVRSTITNTATGIGTSAVIGINNGNSITGSGIRGSHTGSGYGVWGSSAGSSGVYGTSYSGFGVSGVSTFGIGISGSSSVNIAGKFVTNDATNTNPALISTTNSTQSNVSAIVGIISASSPGSNSAGVKGTNNGTGSTGIGVWGDHVGSGYGVYGTSSYGRAVYGYSSDYGFGVFGESLNGAGIKGVSVNGIAGSFDISYANNGSPVLTASTYGDGVTFRATKQNNSGIGAGIVVQKNFPYNGVYTSDPQADLEVRHTTVSTGGMTGLRILNTSTGNNSWTFYTNSGTGNLFLYAKDIVRGSFDASSGAYTATSDVRLKHNLKNYKGTLANLMKIDVKSYQLLNSDKTEVGLLAQEVMQYFPEIVYNNTDDKGGQFYTMDYARIGVLAVKAIQEQQKEINQLKKTHQQEMEELKKEIAELKALIKRK